MDIIPALLLAVPIATILLSVRILMVLQNRKHASETESSHTVITIPEDHKEHTP